MTKKRKQEIVNYLLHWSENPSIFESSNRYVVKNEILTKKELIRFTNFCIDITDNSKEEYIKLHKILKELKAKDFTIFDTPEYAEYDHLLNYLPECVYEKLHKESLLINTEDEIRHIDDLTIAKCKKGIKIIKEFING